MLAALVAAVSPFLGLIFLIGIGGRYVVKSYRQIYVYLALFSATAIGTSYFLAEDSRMVVASTLDSVVGVGIGSLILFLTLLKFKKFEYAILSFGLFSLLYSVFRQFFLMDLLLNSMSESAATVRSYVVNSGISESDFDLMIGSIIESYRSFNPAIWTCSAIMGAYLGAVALSKSKIIFWNHKLIKMPYESIYLLLITLIAFLFLPDKTYPMNLLLILAPVYLIQGISVLDFYWGRFLAKTVVLRFILIIALMLNPYMLIVITFTGLFDVWFNFRKIYTKEDLDENHLS